MYNVYVVGYGSIGKRRSAWLRDSGYDVTVIDPFKDAEKDRFKQVPEITKEAKAVFICTPPNVRESVVAPLAGKFPLVIEKPLFIPGQDGLSEETIEILKKSKHATQVLLTLVEKYRHIDLYHPNIIYSDNHLALNSTYEAPHYAPNIRNCILWDSHEISWAYRELENPIYFKVEKFSQDQLRIYFSFEDNFDVYIFLRYGSPYLKEIHQIGILCESITSVFSPSVFAVHQRRETIFAMESIKYNLVPTFSLEEALGAVKLMERIENALCDS